MKVQEGPLSGLLIIELNVFRDARGFFSEIFHLDRYNKYNIPTFIQDNISRSKRNTIRGLHYQMPRTQGKLITVTRGAIWDVALDVRRSSPTFGQWFGITLSDENHTQLYIPPGFAHGFCALSDEADISYKCTDFYHPESEHGIAWNDPALNIPWPTPEPILSPKDQINLTLAEIPHEKLCK